MPFTIKKEDLHYYYRYGIVEQLFAEYEKYKEVSEDYERVMKEMDAEITKLKEEIEELKESEECYIKEYEILRNNKNENKNLKRIIGEWLSNPENNWNDITDFLIDELGIEITPQP